MILSFLFLGGNPRILPNSSCDTPVALATSAAATDRKRFNPFVPFPSHLPFYSDTFHRPSPVRSLSTFSLSILLFRKRKSSFVFASGVGGRMGSSPREGMGQGSRMPQGKGGESGRSVEGSIGSMRSFIPGLLHEAWDSILGRRGGREGNRTHGTSLLRTDRSDRHGAGRVRRSRISIERGRGDSDARCRRRILVRTSPIRTS